MAEIKNFKFGSNNIDLVKFNDGTEKTVGRVVYNGNTVMQLQMGAGQPNTAITLNSMSIDFQTTSLVTVTPVMQNSDTRFNAKVQRNFNSGATSQVGGVIAPLGTVNDTIVIGKNLPLSVSYYTEHENKNTTAINDSEIRTQNFPLSAAPTISLLSSTSSTITLRLQNNSSLAGSGVARLYNPASNTSSFGVGPFPAETGNIVFSNLSPNTNYTIFYWFDPGAASGQLLSNITEPAVLNRPSIFNVSSSTNSISWSVFNNANVTVTIRSKILNFSEQAISAGPGASVNFSQSSLASSTTYTIEAYSTANNFINSLVASTNASTSAPSSGGGGTTPPPDDGGGTTPPPDDGGGTTPPPDDGGGGGGGCLDVNTPIAMFDGSYKLLKDIKVGDELTGYYIDGMIDEKTPGWQSWATSEPTSGNILPIKVIALKEDYYNAYYLINNTLKITKSHKLFATRDGVNWTWIDSSEIAAGDRLIDIDKNIITVTDLAYIPERIDVITLDVETWDNYFVTPLNILVHNNELVKA
jgi:hypothetical protein